MDTVLLFPLLSQESDVLAHASFMNVSGIRLAKRDNYCEFKRCWKMIVLVK